MHLGKVDKIADKWEQNPPCIVLSKGDNQPVQLKNAKDPGRNSNPSLEHALPNPVSTR